MNETRKIEQVGVDMLTPRPGNRQAGGIPKESLEELAASIREKGVLQPLIARPRAAVKVGEPTYEIVAGERRWRASKLAGLETVPCQVRNMDDAEADDVALVDNLHRADLHPLDEASAYAAIYRRILDQDASAGIDVAAAKVGKPPRYVTQRLQLVHLVEPARALWRKSEHMTLGHALCLCRLPAHVQEKVVKTITSGNGIWILRDGIERFEGWIQREIYMELSRAPWKKDDAQLLPRAGACATCSKRTGANATLFPEVGKKDTCLDAGCYAKKMDAHMEQARQALKDRPHLVVSNEHHNIPKGSLSSGEWQPAKKGDAKAVECLVVDGEDRGKIVYGVKREKGESGRALLTPAEKAKRRKQVEETRVSRRITGAVLLQTLGEVNAHVAKSGALPVPLLRNLALWVFHRSNEAGVGAYMGWEKQKTVHNSGGFKWTSMSWEEPAKEAVEAMSGAETLCFIAACLAGGAMGKEPFLTDELQSMAAIVEINVGRIEKAVRDEAAAIAKEKKQASAARGKKPQKDPEYIRMLDAQRSTAKGPRLENISADEKRMAAERAAKKTASKEPVSGVCRVCGCTDNDCSKCIKKTGSPCHWVDEKHTLCSACAKKKARKKGVIVAHERNLPGGKEPQRVGGEPGTTAGPEEIKKALLSLRKPTQDFTVILSGKKSHKVHGLYKPEKREIVIHNKNFSSDNDMMYTAIHEYAHHLQFTSSATPVSARTHTAAFWNLLHTLLYEAEEKGVYHNPCESIPELKALTVRIRDKFLAQSGALMKELGKLLLDAQIICNEHGTHFQDYLDRVLCLPRTSAAVIMKAHAMDLDPRVGFENMRVLAGIRGDHDRNKAQEDLLAGHSPDMVKVKHDPKKPSRDPRSALVAERERLAKGIESMRRRLKEVEKRLSELQST